MEEGEDAIQAEERTSEVVVSSGESGLLRRVSNALVRCAGFVTMCSRCMEQEAESGQPANNGG